MSLCLTYICDGQFAEGECPQRLTLRTVETDVAKNLAIAAGWNIKVGKHQCPACARAGR